MLRQLALVTALATPLTSYAAIVEYTWFVEQQGRGVMTWTSVDYLTGYETTLSDIPVASGPGRLYIRALGDYSPGFEDEDDPEQIAFVSLQLFRDLCLDNKVDAVMIITLPKTHYSDQVVRKALYWLSERAAWSLEEEPAAWRVTLSDESHEAEQELHRLLNDFCLREELDRTTKGLRTKVIAAALRKLARD